MNISDYAKLYTGKLLRRQELHLPDDIFRQLLNQNLLKEIPGIQEKAIGFQCMRCGNRKPHLFGKIPKQKVYCRKCIEMGRISTFEPLYEWNGPLFQPPEVKNPCAWDGVLTRFQQEASSDIMNAMLQQKQLLVWAVCGAGKTEMLFEGLTACFEKGLRVCLATPRADVVRELIPRFEQVFPNVSMCALYGGTSDKDVGAQFVISTTHQLLRYKNAFDVMIIDEVDAFPYYADQSLSFAANRAKKEKASLVFLTATPRGILKWRAQLGFIPTTFVPARYHGHPLPIPQFQASFSLNKALRNNQLPLEISSWIEKKRGEKRRFLLFVPTIEMAEQISAITKIEHVHASDPNRMEKVEQFRRNEMDAFITTTILERGVTFPSIDVAILDAGHQVFDEAALVQIAGRAGRNAQDPYGEVIFFHQGKSSAMVKARKMINRMNHLARRNS